MLISFLDTRTFLHKLFLREDPASFIAGYIRCHTKKSGIFSVTTDSTSILPLKVCFFLLSMAYLLMSVFNSVDSWPQRPWICYTSALGWSS